MTMYIMVFDDTKEEWHYFKNEFNEKQFLNGFMDYYVVVENNIIKQDTYDNTNTGKIFSESYDTKLWY